MTTTIAWISAHPDDETFTSACTIMEAVRRGVRPVLLCATDGDAGKSGYLPPMTRKELAEKREIELRESCDIMGIASMDLLRHPDGKLSQVPRERLVAQIVDYIGKTGAEVVLTFGEDGMSGHADHIALHHAVREAVVGGQCPSVKKLYYYYNWLIQDPLRPPSVTVDVTPDWKNKAKALLAHESQLLSVERVFGDVRNPGEVPPEQIALERFVLAWKDGVEFPGGTEKYLTDGLS